MYSNSTFLDGIVRPHFGAKIGKHIPILFRIPISIWCIEMKNSKFKEIAYAYFACIPTSKQ